MHNKTLSKDHLQPVQRKQMFLLNLHKRAAYCHETYLPLSNYTWKFLGYH